MSTLFFKLKWCSPVRVDLLPHTIMRCRLWLLKLWSKQEVYTGNAVALDKSRTTCVLYLNALRTTAGGFRPSLLVLSIMVLIWRLFSVILCMSSFWVTMFKPFPGNRNSLLQLMDSCILFWSFTAYEMLWLLVDIYKRCWATSCDFKLSTITCNQGWVILPYSYFNLCGLYLLLAETWRARSKTWHVYTHLPDKAHCSGGESPKRTESQKLYRNDHSAFHRIMNSTPDSNCDLQDLSPTYARSSVTY